MELNGDSTMLVLIECPVCPDALFCLCFFFFFSSRRRHTRLVSDWSSDVCSSDLKILVHEAVPDDDGDGLVDEDLPNGEDDDGDGRCDEDYAAIGQQMFASEYFDDTENIRASSPEHVPLGIKIQQTSYAWSTPGQTDFVGMDYKIINIGGRT